jgi:poly-gamma-glutamate synthesis protein (capsule biosynthesis protein)
MRQTRLIIGGDICPMHRNAEYFCKGDASTLFNDLLGELEQADLVIANLECPLILGKTPIPKTGPVLGAPTESINGVAAGHIGCVGLANNHILDHGEPGVESTLRACSGAAVRTFGAGKNLKEAAEMLVVMAGERRIGLLGVSAQEWSIADENSSGANPLDLIECARTLKNRRAEVDFIILLLHDGAEYYPLPSPRLQKVCRFLIEQGADMVVCQHSHCVGAYEAYAGGHIIYGQGNFLFDSPSADHSWSEGYLVQLTLGPNGGAGWQPIPYTQSELLPGARRMSPERERTFLAGLAERSEAIRDDGFVARSWEQFCRSRQHSFMSYVLGHGRLLRRLNQNGSVVRHIHRKQRLREIKNCILSDTNREVFLGVLDEYLRED